MYSTVGLDPGAWPHSRSTSPVIDLRRWVAWLRPCRGQPSSNIDSPRTGPERDELTGGIRMNRLRRLAAAALLLLGAAAPAFAQGTTGSIEGRISDEQGLALPGAGVSAKNTATGFARSVVTDATGIYRF